MISYDDNDDPPTAAAGFDFRWRIPILKWRKMATSFCSLPACR
jgi:hypothetical protein